jgi:hypothetical protein
LTLAYVAVSTTVRIEPSFTSWVVASILDGSPPHGPPRPYTQFRAPPPLSA